MNSYDNYDNERVLMDLPRTTNAIEGWLQSVCAFMQAVSSEPVRIFQTPPFKENEANTK